MNNISEQIGEWLITGLIGLVIGALGMKWWDAGHLSIVTRTLLQKVPVSVPVAAHVAPQIASAPVAPVKVQTCTVQAYKAPAKVRAHLLPKPVADDPKQVIVASSTVAPDDHPETITATVDTQTGQAVQSVVREPYAPVAEDFRRELSVDLAEKFGGPVARLQVRQDIVQLFGAHVHLMAGADVPVPLFGMAGKPDAYVGVGLHVALP